MSTFVVEEALEHDHRDIDDGFARFRQGLEQGQWLREPFERSAEGLRHHIYVEEEVFFPFLRVGGLVAPVFVMIREHAAIWQALHAVEAAIAATDRDAATGAMASLASILDTHNSKEEQILYPASGQVLATDATEAVRKAFEEGTRPDGWLPGGLR